MGILDFRFWILDFSNIARKYLYAIERGGKFREKAI